MILQKYPFTMVGTIDQCLLFTFQSPPEWAEALLPDCLTPVVHNGCAFWNVVVCHVRDMRPRGFSRGRFPLRRSSNDSDPNDYSVDLSLEVAILSHRRVSNQDSRRRRVVAGGRSVVARQ